MIPCPGMSIACPYISTLLVISFSMWWRAAGGVHRFFDALSIPLFARARETPSPAAAAAHHTRRSKTDLTSPELVSIDRHRDRWCPVFPINNLTRETYREHRPSSGSALLLLSFEEKIIMENANRIFRHARLLIFDHFCLRFARLRLIDRSRVTIRFRATMMPVARLGQPFRRSIVSFDKFDLIR